MSANELLELTPLLKMRRTKVVSMWKIVYYNEKVKKKQMRFRQA